jgi:hypothetical protein
MIAKSLSSVGRLLFFSFCRGVYMLYYSLVIHLRYERDTHGCWIGVVRIKYIVKR